MIRKRVGPRMKDVVSFVEANPGCVAMRVAQAVGPHGSLKYGYATVHRAIRAGVVNRVRDSNRMYLYPVTE